MTPLVSMTAPQFTSSIDPVLDATAFAEESGVDGLFVFDHLLPLAEPERPVLEMAATLGAVAAASSRILVGSLVARAPLRGPAVTAAIGLTVAAIAPGRAVLGLGSGDRLSRPEAVRYGHAFGTVRERVGAVGATLEALGSAPLATWVGGTHPLIVEMALETQGWNGWALPLDVFADKAGVLRGRRPDLSLSWGGAVVLGTDSSDVDHLTDRRGRSPGDVVGTPDAVATALLRFVEAGADHLVVSILPNRRGRWELFAERVLPRLR